MLDKDGNSGAAIEIENLISAGYDKNKFGNGDITVTVRRPNSVYRYLDLFRLNYTQPNHNQIMGCMEAACRTDEQTNMFQRLSFLQADYIKELFITVLEKEFAGGVIPSDEEIKQILLNNRKQRATAENASKENINEPIAHCVIVDTETFNWDEFKSRDDYGHSSTCVIRLAVRNGNGDVFQVGEEVCHQGASDTAIITEFTLDPENGDIIAKTTKGTANVQFLLKLPMQIGSFK